MIETNNFQHMLFKKNCCISISCALWHDVAYQHKATQGLPGGQKIDGTRRAPRPSPSHALKGFGVGREGGQPSPFLVCTRPA